MTTKTTTITKTLWELRLTVRKNDYGEYVLKCYKNGARYTDGDYFTDDLQDAKATLTFEAMRHKDSSTGRIANLNLITGKMKIKYYFARWEEKEIK